MLVKRGKMKNKINVLNSKIEPTTLCESLKLTFDIGRLMGTIPLTLDLYQVQSANPERRAKHDFCFILFYLIIFLIPASYSLYKILINNNQFFIISKNVVFVEALLLVILVFVNVISGYIFRSILRKCVSLINDIDVSVVNFGIDLVRNQDQIKRKIYLILTLMFLTMILRFSLAIPTVPLEPIQEITFFFANFVKSFSKYQFVIIILSMSSRFENIHNEIRNSVTKKSSRIFSRNLNILCTCYYKLCSAFRMVNSTFSAQLLVGVGVSVVDILFHSYYLYVGLVRKHVIITNYMVLIYSIVWVVIEFFEIYILVRACVNTCELVSSVGIN